jgi:hypothetical protein
VIVAKTRSQLPDTPLALASINVGNSEIGDDAHLEAKSVALSATKVTKTVTNDAVISPIPLFKDKNAAAPDVELRQAATYSTLPLKTTAFALTTADGKMPRTEQKQNEA